MKHGLVVEHKSHFINFVLVLFTIEYQKKKTDEMRKYLKLYYF